MFLAIWACCLCLILSASSESSTRHDSASLVDALRKRLEAKETKIEKQGELIDQMQRAVTQLRDEAAAERARRTACRRATQSGRTRGGIGQNGLEPSASECQLG